MKKLIWSFLTILTISSCVTKKQFEELSDKYDRLNKTNASLSKQNDVFSKNKAVLKKKITTLEENQKVCLNKSEKLKGKIAIVEHRIQRLQNSYDDLSKNSSSMIGFKIKENQQLLSKLDTRETQLLNDEVQLKKLRKTLEAKSKRISNLEVLLAQKEIAMQKLKNAISEALVNFEGKGLTVENRNGKIYVSMENKLLFRSGQWTIATDGKKAVGELAKVLVNNPTIHVLIEGHTDSDSYKGGGFIEDNWDLSVKRATAIVRILQKHHVSSQQLTAAGRSEYLPVASNNTKIGKAKNRRIEIVLSPNLDEVTNILKLLNE